MKAFKPKLFKGSVYHKRFFPKVHEFTYGSYFIKISLFNLESCSNLFFSVNRFNLFSFYFKDHGYRDGSSLIDFANNKLKEANINIQYDDIVIHTYPRILGHVFNPVSFWYFYQNGSVICKLAEVNNTFGETISYVLPNDDLSYSKEMQVSPFNLIEGNYQFRFLSKEEHEKVEIRYLQNSQIKIYASIEGRPIEFNAMNLFKTFLQNPFYNIGAVFFIHFEALRLFIKKIPFYGKNGIIKDKIYDK